MNKYRLAVALGAIACTAGAWIFTFQRDMGLGVQLIGFAITTAGLVVVLTAAWIWSLKELFTETREELEQVRESIELNDPAAAIATLDTLSQRYEFK